MAQAHLGESSLSEIIRQFCERAEEFLRKVDDGLVSHSLGQIKSSRAEFDLQLASYDHLLEHGRHLKSHFGVGEEATRSLADLNLQSVLVRQISSLIRGRSRLVVAIKIGVFQFYTARQA